MKKVLFILLCGVMLTSCYVHTYTVGDGVQQGITEKRKQHNFLGGLVSGRTPDPESMANGKKDYKVTNKVSFIDGLLSGLTYGIYTPTTIIVER